MINPQNAKIIMEHTKHQFLYARANAERTNFLQQVAKENPIVAEETTPMALCLSDYGLEDAPIKRKTPDRDVLRNAAENYFNLSLIELILTSIYNQIDIHLNENRLKNFLTYVNRINKINGLPRMKSYERLLEEVKKQKNYFHKFYLEYIEGKVDEVEIKPLLITLDIEYFISEVQKFLRNKAPFKILIDKKEYISPYSTMAINNILGARLDRTLALKIALEDNFWEHFYDASGQIIQDTHDYESTYLDDSHDKGLSIAIKRKFSTDSTHNFDFENEKCRIYQDPDNKKEYIIIVYDNKGITKVLRIYPELTKYDSFIYLKGYLCNQEKYFFRISFNSDEPLYNAIVNLAKSLQGHDINSIKEGINFCSVGTFYRDDYAVLGLQPKEGKFKLFEFKGIDTTKDIYINALINFYCEVARCAESQELDLETKERIRALKRRGL